MKILDKTSLQDANGNINIIARVQGTLKYGLNWYGELEAQKTVIAQMDRMLEKGFVLIRNFTLPNSEIVIPMILVGSSGIFVIFVTQQRGHFEAKSDQWNTVNNDGTSLPATRNLIDLIAKLARAFQKYLEHQKINMQVPVEPVLIASDPGAQIESVRPAVRIVRSDAIKQFASSLLQARPVLRIDSIYNLADRIVTPRSPEELLVTAAVDVGDRRSAAELERRSGPVDAGAGCALVTAGGRAGRDPARGDRNDVGPLAPPRSARAATRTRRTRWPRPAPRTPRPT